tara:strand:- start:136 stop:876 length:741 start_codon:yes stop_codon:yes gene_type:complete
MSVVPILSDEFSTNQLKKWGMLVKAKKESIVDSCLNEVDYPNDEQTKKLIEDWLSQKKIKSKETLKLWQEEQEFSHEEWKEFLIRPWRWQRWCLKHFESKIASYYLKRKQFLDQVTYSLLRVKKRHIANELYLRIKEEESSFSDIACNYSEGPEKRVGGFIGPVSMSQPHPALARLLQVSHSGQLWPPKEIDSWWVVVRLEELHNTELNERIRIQLALELGEQHLHHLLQVSCRSNDEKKSTNDIT